jgi:hypothetical protein
MLEETPVLWLAALGAVGYLLGGARGAALALLFTASWMILARRFKVSAMAEQAKRDGAAKQGPALQTMTPIGQTLMMALEIARHEMLAEWCHTGRTPILEDPIADTNSAGGVRILSDGLGEDISRHYDAIC